MKARITGVVLGAEFVNGTFSRSANPGVGSLGVQINVSNLRSTAAAGVGLTVGGQGVTVTGANPIAGYVTALLPLQNASGFGVIPLGTHAFEMTDRGEAVEQSSPPVTITIAP